MKRCILMAIGYCWSFLLVCYILPSLAGWLMIRWTFFDSHLTLLLLNKLHCTVHWNVFFTLLKLPEDLRRSCSELTYDNAYERETCIVYAEHRSISLQVKRNIPIDRSPHVAFNFSLENVFLAVNKLKVFGGRRMMLKHFFHCWAGWFSTQIIEFAICWGNRKFLDTINFTQGFAVATATKMTHIYPDSCHSSSF